MKTVKCKTDFYTSKKQKQTRESFFHGQKIIENEIR